MEIFIHYESRNLLTKNILYLVHHVKIINIRKYESFEIRRQSESYLYEYIVESLLGFNTTVINHCDRWWEKLLGCGRGEGCWSYPDNEHSLKKTWDSIDDCENNASSSTSCYWKLYFCLLNIFLYLFVCFIQIISDWDKHNM